MQLDDGGIQCTPDDCQNGDLAGIHVYINFTVTVFIVQAC